MNEFQFYFNICWHHASSIFKLLRLPMTPIQYHFPYFIELSNFNSDLAPYHWVAHHVLPQSKNESESILLEPMDTEGGNGKQSPSLHFDFGTFLMVHNHLLFAWRRYEDGLLIRQYDLREVNPELSMLEEFIDIMATEPGRHAHTTRMTYHHFVTFIRKPNLIVKEDYYERYVIILLHEEFLTLIPFDTFNETGGDPLYMWPALATLEPEAGKLYGHGMRMGSFTVQV